MIKQPMFPLGDLNVARCTVAVALDAVDVVVLGGVVTVSLVDPVDVGVAVEKLKLELLELLDVLVTVTVFVPPDPHPVRASAAAMAAAHNCFTRWSLPMPLVDRRSLSGRFHA